MHTYNIYIRHLQIITCNAIHLNIQSCNQDLNFNFFKGYSPILKEAEPLIERLFEFADCKTVCMPLYKKLLYLLDLTLLHASRRQRKKE